jgi:hypothetical protein
MTDETINWKQEAMRQNALLHDAISRAEKAEVKLAKAVEALYVIVNRWDTPSWKDAEATADVINRARAVLAELEKTE